MQRATTQMLDWKQKEVRLRRERMSDPEEVVDKILRHCSGCNQGHTDLIAHDILAFLVKWRSYGGTNEEFSWETQDGLLKWAAYEHHLGLLKQYHEKHGLQLLVGDRAVVEDPTYDQTYESEEDVPRHTQVTAAVHAAALQDDSSEDVIDVDEVSDNDESTTSDTEGSAEDSDTEDSAEDSDGP